jgi:diguanylate cyclase (GGDEF)-like protein/PAS domain S-box-containing protein
MPLFDMRSVITCYVLVSLICAIVMARQWRHFRQGYSGLGYWLVDYLCQLLGLGLIMARGAIPDFLSLTVGNALIVAGLLVLLRGLRAYFRQDGGLAMDIAIPVAFVAAHAWYVLGEDNLAARQIAFSVAMIIACSRGIAVLARVGRDLRRITTDTVVVFSAFILASLARIAVDLSGPPANDFFASGSYDAAILVLYMALFVALTFALVSMSGRRVLLEQDAHIAERAKAEAALRSSEEKFSKAFMASPDAISISRLSDGRFIEVNEGFCRLSGYTREEILAASASDVWRDPEARRAWIAELQASPSVVHRVLTVYGKHGRKLNVGLSGGLVELDGEKHLLSVAHDLSERERAESILRVRLELREFAPGHSVEELMEKALDEIESMTGSSAGFYHFVDEASGTIARQAWSTRTRAEFCDAGDGRSHYPIGEAGVWAECIRRRKPVIHNDYASLPERKGLPAGHGTIHRELVAPTMRDGRIVAILGVANKEEDYGPEDVALVSYIVDLVWTIIVQKRSDERILELNSRLEQLAMTDELTGLANRRAFMDLAGRELLKARRYSLPLSFIMLDIDHFKLVNDRHGHGAGDAMLKMVAGVLGKELRDVDLVARLGGEEFGILLPNTLPADAALSAGRLRAAIALASCPHQGQDLRVTASLGVAALRGEEADLEALMRAADGAMYRAKAAGRDRVETA